MPASLEVILSCLKQYLSCSARLFLSLFCSDLSSKDLTRSVPFT